MFEHVKSLLDDIDALADKQQFPRPGDALASSEVGQAVIMLALGRMPATQLGVEVAETVSDRRQQAARRLIARWFLASESSLYAVLGATPDCSPEVLRENYRRLIALVHPDTRPEGFPLDSAARVNLAYSVLSDAEKRASYDASLKLLKQQNSAPPPHSSTTLPPRAFVVKPRGMRNWFRAATPRMRFGNGLLTIAAVLLAPIALVLYSVASHDTGVEIVEGKAKPVPMPLLTMSTEVSKVVAPESSAPVVDATAREPSPRTPPREAVFSRLRRFVNPPIKVAPPPALVANDVVLAPARLSGQSGPPTQSELAPRAPTSVATFATNVNPVPAERAAQANVPTRTPTDHASQMPVPSGNGAPAGSAAAVSGTPTEVRVTYAEVDELLVKLSNAYESGSITAFSRVLAPSMAGRRQVLSEYEKVFQQTRQRSIRFTQLKHRANGERLSTSGYAVVSTVDNDNRASSQRVFLEIDIAREADSPKIERLLNYPLN